MKRFRLPPTLIAAVLLLSWVVSGCGGASEKSREGETVSQKTLTEVQDAHTPTLMALPGVVGIYQGLTDEGRPCLKVMVVERTAALEEAIPAELEGYLVVIEETGEIRPLGGGG